MFSACVSAANQISWHRFGHLNAESRRKCETTNKTTGMAAFVNFREAKLRYALSMAYQAHGLDLYRVSLWRDPVNPERSTSGRGSPHNHRLVHTYPSGSDRGRGGYHPATGTIARLRGQRCWKLPILRQVTGGTKRTIPANRRGYSFAGEVSPPKITTVGPSNLRRWRRPNLQWASPGAQKYQTPVSDIWRKDVSSAKCLRPTGFSGCE